MKLIYGTFNPAKLASMRRILAGLDIELTGLSDLQSPPHEAVESGNSPLENARIKALAYGRATRCATLAADSGLYLQDVPDALQPGEHARRIDGARLDDEGMIAHYSRLAASMGGRIVARYLNAACIVLPDGRLFERFDDSLSSRPFYLVQTPHTRRTKGFPLDSLSVDIQSGLYYYDMPPESLDSELVQEDGFRRFVREALGVNA